MMLTVTPVRRPPGVGRMHFDHGRSESRMLRPMIAGDGRPAPMQHH